MVLSTQELNRISIMEKALGFLYAHFVYARYRNRVNDKKSGKENSLKIKPGGQKYRHRL